MSGLFGGSKPTAPIPPPPIPQIDDAVAARNSSDQTNLQRGRATTVLTSNNGLPDLGSTQTPSVNGMNKK